MKNCAQFNVIEQSHSAVNIIWRIKFNMDPGAGLLAFLRFRFGYSSVMQVKLQYDSVTI